VTQTPSALTGQGLVKRYPDLTALDRLTGPSRPARSSPSSAPIDPWATRRAGTLSQRNRQRPGLAAAVLHRPALLVLDESTNVLGPSGVQAGA
jgi:ABC-2 type transport system ATP-binding protein